MKDVKIRWATPFNSWFGQHLLVGIVLLFFYIMVGKYLDFLVFWLLQLLLTIHPLNLMALFLNLLWIDLMQIVLLMVYGWILLEKLPHKAEWRYY